MNGLIATPAYCYRVPDGVIVCCNYDKIYSYFAAQRIVRPRCFV